MFACGIDFGTSNSTAAVATAAGSRLLPLEDDKLTLPSAVFFNVDENSLAFGRAAMNEYLTGYDGRLMRSLKSLLGSNLMESGTEVGGRHLAYRDLIGCFIGEIKRRTEAHTSQELDAVVLGRPVRFVDDDTVADQKAQATLAEIVGKLGFREVSFQFEPIAAAHTYEQNIAREELVLVVDIGGGTSDFSLVRLSPQRRHIEDRNADLLGNTGVHIGGTDFDKRLSLASVMPALGLGTQLKRGAQFPNSSFFQLATWHTINQVYTRKAWRGFQDIAPDVADKVRFDRLLNVVQKQAGHRIAMRVEASKIELSSSSSSTLSLEEAENGLNIVLYQQDFERAIANEVTRVCDAANACVRRAAISRDDIDTLFFTGGSSAVPSLRAALSRHFPAALAVEGDLYGSVGCGLAVVARQRYGS